MIVKISRRFLASSNGRIPDGDGCVGAGDVCDGGGDEEQRGVEESGEDHEDHDHPRVVPQLVRHEAHQRRRQEDAEGDDGVDQGHVQVADADILQCCTYRRGKVALAAK